jgi:hypothetical protein
MVEGILKESCLEISKRFQIHFLEIGSDKDHVHFLIGEKCNREKVNKFKLWIILAEFKIIILWQKMRRVIL